MIGTITTAAAAAAPHVGPALLAGGKALVGFAVATKATRYAQTQVHHLVNEFDEARYEAQQAREAARETTDNVTPVKVKETKTA